MAGSLINARLSPLFDGIGAVSVVAVGGVPAVLGGVFVVGLRGSRSPVMRMGLHGGV